MFGEKLDYKKHLSLQLGQYCQVHEEDNPKNSQITRTKGEISLGPSGNLQGRFKFMALNSGKKIVRRSWNIIPMPDLVIDRLNALCRDQPQHIIFTDRHERLIGDVQIPGVDDEEENGDHLPGVVPVIAYCGGKRKASYRLYYIKLQSNEIRGRFGLIPNLDSCVTASLTRPRHKHACVMS
jgi:hypothetical protein